jgi:hypothetical protein
VSRISFQTSLLFAPLAYALHHIEEHIFFNFREWRTRYFPDNNQIPTEAVVCLLMAVTLVYLILHSIRQSRASVLSILIFLMATQVHNLLFHLGGTIVFRDFSPGTITAVLLYLPVNLVILRKASEEGWINWKSGVILFLLGGAMFWPAEAFGPPVFIFAVLCTWIWVGVSGAGGQTTEPTTA